MDAELQRLNDLYAIPGQVCFQAGPGGLLMAVINNAHARGTMTLAGGHVLDYTPHGSQPVLWVSPNACYTVGKAMRGGVPVCWPWFGAHPDDPQAKPMHGLVRTLLWQVTAARALPGGETQVCMSVSETEATRAAWDHPFSLELRATFGPRLRVEWSARNPGSQAFTYTGALHPYFAVSDVTRVSVRGLEGFDYLDKVEGFRRKTLPGAVTFTGEVDRVFLDTLSEMRVEDPGWRRAIRIAKQGSRTSVVWNPHEKDAASPDLGAGQHRRFVCAEAANAFEDSVTVAPGGEARLGMEIWTEPL
jgi:D-hexose-6-phosphate mutarotase